MPNALTTFTFAPTNAQVRTVTIDGNPWFVAADVCAILDIANTSQAVARLDADEYALFKIGKGVGRSSLIISESGLYALIMQSRRPEAEAFSRWVRKVVLPTLRKDGMYVMGEEKVALAQAVE
jgi:prophage antirepressor-like protein